MRLHRALGITLLACCGVLAGLLIYRSTHRPRVLLVAPASASAAGAGDASEVAGLEHSAIPDQVPPVRMPDLNGAEQSLRAYLGHPLIINFWATWCAPCRREMPLLQQLWMRDRPTGLRIVGIAVDSPAAVRQYLHQTPVGYPLLVGQEQGIAAASSFGIEPVLPFTVFADARGRIVAVKVGELHRSEADDIVAAVQRVSDGQDSLPQARAAIAAQLRALARAADSSNASGRRISSTPPP